MDKLLNNITFLRIFAVVMGILLWIVVHLDDQASPAPTSSSFSSRTISDVQITETGLNTELYHLQEINSAYVNIVLRGREAAINQVRPNDGQSQIQVDLSGVTEGAHTIPLQSVGFPTGVQVDIYPNTVTVTIEEILNKEVPIEVKTIGEPADGFRVGSPIVSPARAHVTLPASQIDEVVAVLAVIDITGAEQTIQSTERLFAVDAAGSEIEAVITPSVVEIEVPVTSPFKTVPFDINVLNQPPPGYSVASISQSVNELTVFASEEVLAGIEFFDGIDIDIGDLRSSRTFTHVIEVPNTMHYVHPESIEVTVEIVPSIEQTFEQFPITVSGENAEYSTLFITPADGLLNLTLEAAPGILESVTGEDIQAIVDIANLPPGIHERPIRLIVPTHVKPANAQQLNVRIEIKPKDEETMVDVEEEQISEPTTDDELEDLE